ncbi:ubiquitin-conjugating enzyme E2 7 isoform X2 [Physcomitrium patens]|uniref:ubiquitin-conjugating enzyme E2 7 isoform X2 n=1 Tax=Physcomitrium patens TaxID=3218 RepID=UPI000D17D796|nr:ubiquitin-conjugating enzyme E2 7-like isoform X2 [Physcomitrium patens]|eukprot:XP_024379835.1 ubiquitin-conjugating enzyme E2 7-like isoform X2 [Physcomitrella patens]
MNCTNSLTHSLTLILSLSHSSFRVTGLTHSRPPSICYSWVSSQWLKTRRAFCCGSSLKFFHLYFFEDLSRNPVDGFSAGLVDDSNLFEWNVTIIGPPDTLYEGGYFTAIMSFPPNYPNSPPSVRFTSDMWHPNVYPDGRVCISILHAPGDDPNGYELASERWSPVHTVETILLSIISMLSSPNDESPANIDAAVRKSGERPKKSSSER